MKAYYITVREGAMGTDFHVGEEFREINRQCYLWNASKPVENPELLPKVIRQLDDKKLHDVFWAENFGIVNDRFKDIIEAHEPDVSEFFPITVLDKKGNAYDKPHYIFHPIQRVTCVLRSERKPSIIWVRDTGQPIYRYSESHLVLSAPQIGNRKVFTAQFGGNGLIVTKEIGDALKKTPKIRYLRMHDVKLLDRPWVPEENIPELLQWYAEHPEESMPEHLGEAL